MSDLQKVIWSLLAALLLCIGGAAWIFYSIDQSLQRMKPPMQPPRKTVPFTAPPAAPPPTQQPAKPDKPEKELEWMPKV